MAAQMDSISYSCCRHERIDSVQFCDEQLVSGGRVSRMLTLESKEDDEKVLSDLHKKLAGLTDVKMDDEKTEIVIEKDTMSITVRDGIHLHCISRNYGPHLEICACETHQIQNHNIRKRISVIDMHR